jgi:hypothetical protein
MKYLFCITAIALLTFCGKKTQEEKDLTTGKPKPPAVATDSILTFAYQLDIQDSAILNTSVKQVDLLFNSVDGFLGGKKNRTFYFPTECLNCEPVQKYKNGLLFGQSLFFTSDSIVFYKTLVPLRIQLIG